MNKSTWWGLGILAGILGGLWWFFGRKAGAAGQAGSGNPRLTPTGVQGDKRGERNNNPCNLTPLPNGVEWDGQTGVDSGGDQPYLIFSSPVKGIRAAGINALNYYLKDGRTTLAAFSAWGPANNGGQYGEDLAATLGVDSSINFDVPNNLENLLKAISINENGEVPFTEDDWAMGASVALAAKGYSS